MNFIHLAQKIHSKLLFSLKERCNFATLQGSHTTNLKE